METTILIKEYNPVYQEKIDHMMSRIQDEFSELITTSHSTKIHEVYTLPAQKYWVALFGNEIAGTIGIVLFSKQTAVVKRMMVDPAFRGPLHNTAALLMEKAFEWAKQYQTKTVYLGTMEQFKAAQRFYEKKGFIRTAKETLPQDYSVNPMDSIFYYKTI